MDTWKNQVNHKLDRIMNDLEFVKNRTTAYLGRNEAITYLADETPIFVNTEDFGCPLNFINGGLYEEEYFTVFRSYRKPNSVFLDIGANLGVYSLRLAPMLRKGKIFAFEPIPRIRNLFERSVFLNGYGDRITVFPFALSDVDGQSEFTIPAGHAGGASLEIQANSNDQSIPVQLKRLDNLPSLDMKCDLIKLDVEGHELHVLHGARKILERSTNCVIMFEKLSINSGIEKDMAIFAKELGYTIYAINGTSVEPVDVPMFENISGYFIMGRNNFVEDGGRNRDLIIIYPDDLNILAPNEFFHSRLSIKTNGQHGVVVFHGPYWFISRGYYRLTIFGEISGQYQLELCERFGFKVLEWNISKDQCSFEFPVYRDLSKAELVLRESSSAATISLEKIILTRIG